MIRLERTLSGRNEGRRRFKQLYCSKSHDSAARGFSRSKMKSFVVNEREDPVICKSNNMTFVVKFIGNPKTDISRYANLKHNDTLYNYLTKIGGWQALIPIEHTYQNE